MPPAVPGVNLHVLTGGSCTEAREEAGALSGSWLLGNNNHYDCMRVY